MKRLIDIIVYIIAYSLAWGVIIAMACATPFVLAFCCCVWVGQRMISKGMIGGLVDAITGKGAR